MHVRYCVVVGGFQRTIMWRWTPPNSLSLSSRWTKIHFQLYWVAIESSGPTWTCSSMVEQLPVKQYQSGCIPLGCKIQRAKFMIVRNEIKNRQKMISVFNSFSWTIFSLIIGFFKKKRHSTKFNKFLPFIIPRWHSDKVVKSWWQGLSPATSQHSIILPNT